MIICQYLLNKTFAGTSLKELAVNMHKTDATSNDLDLDIYYQGQFPE